MSSEGANNKQNLETKPLKFLAARKLESNQSKTQVQTPNLGHPPLL
jgi:hypothetical protein